ncbi:hypothetical protein [Methyloceanibacter caenitepidi]|uniref:hypothetical protein n=1 Tax=Methyloceanibacter caenitepidi TaxID=1384459 RepID=UPI0005EF9ACD|nr:hypothetical protein [Methyloceanibacter caenitepidi]
MQQAQETYTQGSATFRRHEGGTYFNEKTPDDVKRALERARVNGERVRLFYGDTETGKAWLEEYGVAGTINRSTGPCKIPLIIASSRSHGGPAILDSCIVAIRGRHGWLYRHPQFDRGAFTMHYGETPIRVSHNGETWATFKTPKQALRRIAFMRGERLAP